MSAAHVAEYHGDEKTWSDNYNLNLDPFTKFNEKGHPFLSLKENQKKLKLQHDQNSPKEGRPL